MKKLLLISFCLLVGFTGFSQTIFTQNFESAWSLPPTLSPAWSGTTTPVNNVWHQCSYTTGWTSPASGIYAPLGANSSTASARFHTYEALLGSTGEFITPTIDLSAHPAGTVRLDFYFINANGTDVINVFVSSDDGATWSSALAPSPFGISAVWTLKSVTLPGNSATTKVKFTATSDYGTTDIGIDEIKLFVPVAPDAAPTAFTSTAVSQTGMEIGWTDNSTNETAFRVYRSSDNITFTQQGSDIPSTSTATSGTIYAQVQTNLIPGVTYYYRIASVLDIESAYLTGSQATNAAGTVTSLATGNWSDIATWSTGVVPTATDNVIIADGHTVNIDIVAPTCLDLTVGQGTSGVLTFTSAVASTFTVNGSITIAAGGSFNAGTTATTIHNVNIGGSSATSPYASNLTVNGSFDMWASATTGKATVTFYGTQNSVISGTGAVLNFTNTNINKGNTIATATVTPPVLDIQRSFTVQGANAFGFVTTHTAGTIKISGTFTQSNPIYATSAYAIPATAGIWLSNANFTVPGLGASPTVTGLFRVTAGTYNIGTSSGNSMASGIGAVFMIEGGAINVAGRFNLTSAGVYYNQSGGTLSVAILGNASTTNASFGITSSSASFNMSGGAIVLVQRNSGTLGATTRDYYVIGTPNFTGGTLQVGSAATAVNFNFRLYGYAPNLVIDNTTNNKKAEVYQTLGQLHILGTLTVNTGTTFDCLGFSAFAKGNVINNGIIQGLISGSRFDFAGTTAQSYSGTGTLGTALAPFIGTGVGVANTNNVTLSSPVFTTRVNLFGGMFINSNQFTLGIGGTSSVYIQRGGSAGPAGSFDVAPTFNIGSGGMTVNYYTANSVTTSGVELPASRTLANLVINNASGVILSGGALSTAAMTMTLGTLTTTPTDLLTVTGSGATAITYTAGFVNGPLVRTLPANLVTGTTYLFPVGKSAYKPLELVNPLTTAGGMVVIQAEVFDANCGGTAGTNMSALNTDRYWNATITSGMANFTSSAVRLTEAGLTGSSGIAKSSTLTGAYDLAGSTAPTATTIISDAVTSLDYFVVGTKSVPMTYTSSTVTQAGTATVLQNAANQAIIGIQVVTNNNASPIDVTKFTVNANGTTAVSDISNAKIWYTGTSATFAATTQIGATFASPSLTSFDITGTQSLVPGTNYFWLTFDIPLSAIATHTVDAECTIITVAGVDFTPTVTAPAGISTIVINPPTALTALVVSVSEIDLAWTKNSLDQNVLVATNSTNAFGIPIDGTPYNVGDALPTAGTVIYNGPVSGFNHLLLSANTTYYYKAWSVDANSYYSATGATVNATTPCAAVTAFPFTESFAATLGCWSYAENIPASIHWGTATTDVTHGVTTAQSGTYFARLDVYNAATANNPYFLVSPSFTLDATAKQVKYYYWLGSGGYTLTPVPLKIQVSTNDGSTWTDLYAHTSANSVFTTTSSVAGWTLNVIDLSSYVSQTVKFRFASNSNYGSGFTNQGIDEFVIEDLPSCPSPSALTATGITSSSADLGWTATSTNYDIEYGPAGFTQGTGTLVLAVANPYNLTGLTASTGYDFYVRGNCPGPLQSSWAGPKSFTTSCAALIALTESFDLATFPACWSQQQSAGVTTGIWSVKNTATAGGSPNEMSLFYQNIASGTSRLVSPAINTAGVTKLLVSFRHKFDDYASGVTMKVQSSTDGITWTDESFSITSGNGNVGPANAALGITNNLGAVTYIAWTAVGNLYSYDNWAIDNVSITPQPALDLSFTSFYQTASSLSKNSGGTDNNFAVDVNFHNNNLCSTLESEGNFVQASNINNTVLLPNSPANGVARYPVTPVGIEALVTNNGFTASDYLLNWAVDGVAQPSYNGPVVAANEGTDLASLTYTPASRGTFITTGSVVAAGDAVAGNNDNSFRMRVYPDVFTRTTYDNGTNTPETFVGWNSTTNAMKAGVRYTTTANTQLAGVDFIYRTEAVTSGTVLIQVRAAGATTLAPGALLYSRSYSTPAYIPSGTGGDYITFAFGDDAPVIASGSDYWITIKTPVGVLYSGGAQKTGITAGRSFYESNTDTTAWNAFVLSTVDYAWIMRAINVTPPPVPTAFLVNGGGSYCEGSGGLPVGLDSSESDVTYTLFKDGVAQIPAVSGTGSSITFGNQLAGTYTVTGTNNGGTSDMTGSAVITETAQSAVSVLIAADQNNVCPGTTVTLTATPIGGGTAPEYQWYKNAGAVATGATYAYIPVNGDIVYVVLTSNAPCVTGNPATSNIITLVLNSVPDAAGSINGAAVVCAGENQVGYAVAAIAGATSYVWTVPNGASISGGNGSNSITVDFGLTALSGNITVAGNNTCGNGIVSPGFSVTVNAKPSIPVISQVGGTLFSDAPAGNQWYMDGIAIDGATAASYDPTMNGTYTDIVTINGCASDLSNSLIVIDVRIENPTAGQFEIFPVPSNGFFTATLAWPSAEIFTIRVYNNIGSLVFEKQDVMVNGSAKQTIDMRPVPSGVYTVTFTSGLNQVIRKMIINRD